jgi:DNA (cytosine-5)-methyltransferase 1
MDGTIEVPKDLIEKAGVNEDSILVGEGEPYGVVHPYLIDRCKQRNLEYNGKRVGEYGFSFGKRVSAIHCEIVDIKMPSKTIISTYDHQPRLFVAQRVGEKYYLRPYTVNELKQIQGFPKDYVMEGSWKDQVVQLGNAVPPPLIQKIVESMTLKTV